MLPVHLIALGAGLLATGCQNGGYGRPAEPTQGVRAALTVSASPSVAAHDQALADAFARQAAMYAQVAATDRAQAAAISVAITTERELAAVKAIAAPNATSATAPALATAGTSVANPAPATTGVPAAAAKLQGHYQKAAALADQLGANAQALASFHLARAGVAAEGGAQ